VIAPTKQNYVKLLFAALTCMRKHRPLYLLFTGYCTLQMLMAILIWREIQNSWLITTFLLLSVTILDMLKRENNLDHSRHYFPETPKWCKFKEYLLDVSTKRY